MMPLHIAIAKSVFHAPRDFTSADFQSMAKERGLADTASSGAIQRLESLGFVEKVGEKKRDSSRGRNLKIFRIVEEKKFEIEQFICNARPLPDKAKPKEIVVRRKVKMAQWQKIQKWLDNITRRRLV